MTANVPWMPCPVHFHYIERKSVFVLKYLLYKLLGINKSLGSIHTALKRHKVLKPARVWDRNLNQGFSGLVKMPLNVQLGL